MVILRQATIKYKGYDPEYLKPKSTKKICCSCNNPECKNPIRWLPKQAYRDLCKKCIVKDEKRRRKISESKMGDKNPMYGRTKELSSFYNHKHTKESKEKNRIAHLGKPGMKGKDNPNWGKFGKANPNYGNHKLVGENGPHYGKFGKNHPAWKGGFNRSHVLPKSQCVKLNTYFIGAHFHHITKSVGVYIPKSLHRHIWHNLKSGQGMGSINLLALQFINGMI